MVYKDVFCLSSSCWAEKILQSNFEEGFGSKYNILNSFEGIKMGTLILIETKINNKNKNKYIKLNSYQNIAKYFSTALYPKTYVWFHNFPCSIMKPILIKGLSSNLVIM